MNQKITEDQKSFDLSKFQMFFNKRFKEILNAVANHSIDIFSQRRKNFHTLKDRIKGMETRSRLFPIVEQALVEDVITLIRISFRMIDRKIENNPVSCLQITQF